jgi:hypothetical protein
MGNTTSTSTETSVERFLETTKYVTHPLLQKIIQDIDPTQLELQLAEQEIKYPCARTRWISIMQEEGVIDWSDSVWAAISCAGAMMRDEPTYEYVEALIGYIGARSLKGGIEGARSGIRAMYRLTHGLVLSEKIWKLDDRAHPHGKERLRQLATNAVSFFNSTSRLTTLAVASEFYQATVIPTTVHSASTKYWISSRWRSVKRRTEIRSG